MGKPSVIFINRIYPPQRGASGRVLRDLARGFARDGWDVTVISTGPAGRGSDQDGPVRLVRVKAPVRSRRVLPYLRVWVKLLGAALRQKRADLIITLSDPPLIAVAGRITARVRKSRHIHRCHDLYPDLLPHVGLHLPSFVQKALMRLSRRTMKSCDKVVVIGRCMARRLTHDGLDPRRVTLIPNWPDAELLAPGQKKIRRGGKRALHIVNEIDGARPYEEQRKDGLEARFRVLYSGNLGRAHDIKTVLQAAEILGQSHPEIEFVFVGDGPGFDWLARERAQRGLDNVRLMPYQPAEKLREIMESGDLHLVTMKHEAEGLLVPCKFYSALAAGRPCIFLGPRDSEVGRVIREFGAGEVIPQKQSQRLADVIVRYRNSSADWFAAYEGAQKAGQVFVPQEAIKAWIERARDVIGRPVPAARKGRKAA